MNGVSFSNKYIPYINKHLGQGIQATLNLGAELKDNNLGGNAAW